MDYREQWENFLNPEVFKDRLINISMYITIYEMLYMSNCGLFKKLSKDTWRILSRAYNNHLTFGEDAITSIILDQIIENSNFSIVISDTRPKENTCGCDFEMWIGGKKGWYRYAIQAKKLDIGSQTYKSLHHTIGKLKIPQIDVLETYSKKVNAFPLYS